MYKINLQKSAAFLYANNKLTERGNKKIIPFKIATKTIKYLEINLTKEIKYLYSENYTTLKKLKRTQTNGSIYRVHGLEESTSLKCPYYPKQSTYSTQSLLKYQ